LQVKALKKRVADLEQQKKELQSEPNEIRELIRAAQPAEEDTREAEALRGRVAALEKDAEDIADDAERRMRALRQEMESQRAAYEKRLNTLQSSNKELSNKLAAKGPGKAAGAAPLGKKDQEKQVAEVRSHYQKKIKALQQELTETQEQLASAKSALERRGKGSPRSWGPGPGAEGAGAEGQTLDSAKSEAVQELEQRILQARQRIPRTPVKGQGADDAAEVSCVSPGCGDDQGAVAAKLICSDLL